MRFFIGLMVFFELVNFIARAIYLIEGDYPRPQTTSRNFDIVGAFLAAALAYWGLVLLSP